MSEKMNSEYSNSYVNPLTLNEFQDDKDFITHPSATLPAQGPTSEPVFRSSQILHWKKLEVEKLQLPPTEHLVPPLNTHTIIFIRNHPVVMAQQRDGKFDETTLLPNQFIIAPAWQSSQCCWLMPLNILSVRVEHSFIVEVANQLGLTQADQLEIPNNFGAYDSQLESIGQLIQNELFFPSAMTNNQFYIDSLANLLAVHLIRYHSSFNTSNKLKNSLALTDLPLGTEVLKRAIEYIRANLEQELSLEELAKVAGLSPYHFARQFKKIVGLAPHEYLIYTRIERAKQLLLESNLTIKEVAAQSGFYDQGHLARYTKRVLGVNPKQIRDSRHSV